MERYKNLGGSSGISAYEVGSDSIIVEFSDGSAYLYDYSSPGATDVEHMKSLAASGRGLNSFISREIRKRYAEKLR